MKRLILSVILAMTFVSLYCQTFNPEVPELLTKKEIVKGYFFLIPNVSLEYDVNAQYVQENLGKIKTSRADVSLGLSFLTNKFYGGAAWGVRNNRFRMSAGWVFKAKSKFERKQRRQERQKTRLIKKERNFVY